MDKSQMLKDKKSNEFRSGLDDFMQASLDNRMNRVAIRCPCIKCGI